METMDAPIILYTTLANVVFNGVGYEYHDAIDHVNADGTFVVTYHGQIRRGLDALILPGAFYVHRRDQGQLFVIKGVVYKVHGPRRTPDGRANAYTLHVRPVKLPPDNERPEWVPPRQKRFKKEVTNRLFYMTSDQLTGRGSGNFSDGIVQIKRPLPAFPVLVDIPGIEANVPSEQLMRNPNGWSEEL